MAETVLELFRNTLQSTLRQLKRYL